MDLKKAFDGVLREIIRWTMHKLGVEERLVLAIMSMYTGEKTVVRSVYGNSKCHKLMQKAAIWPCGIRGRGVGSNSNTVY